ncbi:type IV pilus assembly protein PilQ [Onishia taeanensis]|uniref:Type IV pilus assembly protein PilQ n=1 Tax=Onishia taeanensis TaxID=284577 RepID=A0A1G7P366_9GAMM|nr:type IV pilus secretin PilQ family protein [Halomonas taeanensis]SDF80674.1 type IV pilus assembly protein PilQ [Halomonas taeanensis]
MQIMMRVSLALMLVCGLPATALGASTLTGLEVSQGSTGELEVDMRFDGEVPQVRGYRLDSPPRLSIDLVDTANGLAERRREIGLAGVDRLITLEAGSRTRLVFDLDAPLAYRTRQIGNRLELIIGDAAAPATASASAPAASTSASDDVSTDPQISSFDFQRGVEGGGRLVVNFDRAGVASTVRESGNSIIAELPGVELPAAQDQVLDVTDFGTPMTRVVPSRVANGVRLSIDTQGNYAMFSTLQGRQLIVEARPITREQRVDRDETRASYDGERISLNFQDIEVRAVLAIIADVSGLNLVASDSVSGRVTLNLDDVPWDQALDLVLQSHGLSSRREGNVIVVAPASELANIERQEIEAREQMQVLAPLTTEYLQVKYAKASELAKLLRGGEGFGLLTERGRVSVDERTNTLLIQDTADQIREILRTVEKLDVAVRQVQIEARIVIARDGVTQELGVNWGMSSADSINGVLGNGSSANLSGASTGVASNGGLAVDLGSANSASTSFSFGYLSGDVLLDLELNALETENKSQTISQPRVITANQRTAIIKQGQEIPYQEATSSGATNIEFKEAVLSLEVTPQITPDNRVIMDLAINNDTVSDQSFAGAPAIDTNQIETQVLVDNGETVVLGGILTQEELRSLSKTPFLGDLPVLGHLFRYTQEQNEKVELLIFITPRILEDRLALR